MYIYTHIIYIHMYLYTYIFIIVDTELSDEIREEERDDTWND